MDIDTIVKILEKSVEVSQGDYKRNLKKFGQHDPMTNFHEGKLAAYESLLKLIEINKKINGGM